MTKSSFQSLLVKHTATLKLEMKKKHICHMSFKCLMSYSDTVELKLKQNTYLHISAYSSNHGIFFQNLHHLH